MDNLEKEKNTAQEQKKETTTRGIPLSIDEINEVTAEIRFGWIQTSEL